MKVLSNADDVIARTLRTSMLIDGFWERWLVHGIDRDELTNIRSRITTIEGWSEGWLSVSNKMETIAGRLKEQKQLGEAEYMYRAASLGYNLIHWIYPDRNTEKRRWYSSCIRAFHSADLLSPIETWYKQIEVENNKCPGRIRIPSQTRGCIIIVNPIDSTKEELFKYEMDFNQGGYITVSFDGPGQGETYTFNGLRGTKTRWESFMDNLIEFTADEFPGLPVYLFGTSLGASWAVYGSCHPLVKKTVACSPAVQFERLQLPAYFLERMDYSCTLIPEQRAIPDFKSLRYRSPVMVVHGKKDQMVHSSDMYQLYESLPAGKSLTEYEEEGHCCNYRLAEIRQRAMSWFALK
ncbi:alpha/beta hydrolase [Paenibacillus cremeus]|uniref:Lysophospholipase n=1 Tax=Paenibacillus cremeus TaxID=2163881 RepID=A0A559K7I2_9BACL|nr:alpha/beta hydrolase [Paenibacillus cremeus]TVY08077.1 lysophospholipase [Paenibacillus cremeus]